MSSSCRLGISPAVLTPFPRFPPMIAKPLNWVASEWRIARRPSTLFPRAVTSERAENRGERVTGSEWTCARCGMTSRFMDEAIDLSGLPANWDEVNGIAYCLGCRREMAGQARAAAVAD